VEGFFASMTSQHHGVSCIGAGIAKSRQQQTDPVLHNSYLCCHDFEQKTSLQHGHGHGYKGELYYSVT